MVACGFFRSPRGKMVVRDEAALLVGIEFERHLFAFALVGVDGPAVRQLAGGNQHAVKLPDLLQHTRRCGA